MTRFLHSNGFFAISIAVMLAWLVALLPGPRIVKVVECPYRVSERGVIHGPDSPFWGLTSQNPCFSSERKAAQHVERLSE